MNKEESDSDHEEEAPKEPVWLRRRSLTTRNEGAGDLFHYTMIALILGVVFVVGGSLFWYVLNDGSRVEWTKASSGWVSQGQFIFGGLLSIGWVLKIFWKPIDRG